MSHPFLSPNYGLFEDLSLETPNPKDFTPLISSLPPLTLSQANDPIQDNYRHHYGLDISTAHRLGTLKVGADQLAVQIFEPQCPTGTTLIVHGYQDHLGLMRHWIEYLLNKGQVVIGCDLPGHGLSQGERGAIGSFDQYQQVLKALLATTASFPRPLSLMGQSTGAAILSQYLLTGGDAPDGKVIYSAPLVRARAWHKIRWSYRLMSLFREDIPRKFTNNSHDQQFLDFVRYQDSLQNHRLRLQWIGAMLDWSAGYQGLCGRDDICPLIIQGEQDETVDWRFNLQTLTRQYPNQQRLLLKDGRHNLANEVKEIRQQYFHWLDQHW